MTPRTNRRRTLIINDVEWKLLYLVPLHVPYINSTISIKWSRYSEDLHEYDTYFYQG